MERRIIFILFVISILFLYCCNDRQQAFALAMCTKTCGDSVTNTIIPFGGTPPYTIAWSSSTGEVGSGTLFAFSPDEPGTITVTAVVTDANGCTTTETNTIVVNLPTLNVINVPDLVCPDNINLNIYVDAGATTPLSFYEGTQIPCTPIPGDLIANPTNYLLSDGQNNFTVCNGLLTGGTCCDCEPFTLWSTCDPALFTYNIVQLGDDLCDDGQVCFEVDLSPCEAPSDPSFTETVTWSTTPSVVGVESDDGTTYEICFTQAELDNAGLIAGQTLEIEVGLEITNSNTGASSCGDSMLDDFDYVVDDCCNCMIAMDIEDAANADATRTSHTFVDQLNVGFCGGGFLAIFGNGVDNDEGYLIFDDEGCGLAPNGGTIYSGGLVNAAAVEAVAQAELDAHFGAGVMTVVFDGTDYSVSGPCGNITDIGIEYACSNPDQTAGCTSNISIVCSNTILADASCCP